MRHASEPEHIPISPFNGFLVAHSQRRDDACLLRVGDTTFDGVTHLLADLHQPISGTGCGQFLRRWVFGSGADITGCLDALTPQPQFIIKAMRVTVAMRLLEPHGHAPKFTGTNRLRLALQIQGGFGGFPVAKTAVPTQLNQRR